METITVVNVEGIEEEMEVVFTFKNPENNKNYVLLIPQEIEEDLDLDDVEDVIVDVYAYSYEENEDGSRGELFPIDTQEEWDMVDEVLESFESEEMEM